MKDFFSHYKGEESVPDPYYGVAEDFEFSKDLIEDGCEVILILLADI